MRYIRSPKSLSAAITIANHHGRTKIARLIDDYAKNLAALDEETTVVESSSELSYVPQSNINDQAHLRSPTSTDHSNSQPISEEKSLKSVLKSDNFSTVVTPDMDFDSSAVKKANSKVKFDVESNGSNFVSAPGSPVRDNLMEGDDEIRINSNLKKLKKKLPPNPFSITNSNNLSTSSPLRQQVDEMNKYNKNSKRKNIGNGSTNLFDDIKHNLTASPSPVKKSRYLS